MYAPSPLIDNNHKIILKLGNALFIGVIPLYIFIIFGYYLESYNLEFVLEFKNFMKSVEIMENTLINRA
jgi:hypothetical protein